jgi:hypothetical protein
MSIIEWTCINGHKWITDNNDIKKGIITTHCPKCSEPAERSNVISTSPEHTNEVYYVFLEEIKKTYESQNADYGNSFDESINEYGPIAGLVRIRDKFNRANNLILHPKDQKVNDESIKDTLLDMANYCIMLAAKMSEKK